MLIVTLMLSTASSTRTPDSLSAPLESIDRKVAGFVGLDNQALTGGVLAELRPTSYLSRTYRKEDLKIDLFIAYYAEQRAGESMHSPKHCLPGAGWEVWDYGSLDVPVQGQSFKVNRYSINNESQRMVVLYWYQSRKRIVASEYLGKLLLSRDALLKNSTAASIVRIIAPARAGSIDEARSFASAIIPEVGRCFGRSDRQL